MKNIVMACIVMASLANCGNADQKKIETLESEVMAIHDEIMPKMGEIMTLKDEIATNLKNIDSTAANYNVLKAEADSLSYLLNTSDNGMMDWMDEYNADTLKAISPADAQKYLVDQKTKISAIKESTEKSIETVKKYLKK